MDLEDLEALVVVEVVVVVVVEEVEVEEENNRILHKREHSNLDILEDRDLPLVCLEVEWKRELACFFWLKNFCH